MADTQQLRLLNMVLLKILIFVPLPDGGHNLKASLLLLEDTGRGYLLIEYVNFEFFIKLALLVSTGDRS